MAVVALVVRIQAPCWRMGDACAFLVLAWITEKRKKRFVKVAMTKGQVRVFGDVHEVQSSWASLCFGATAKIPNGLQEAGDSEPTYNEY